MICKNCEKELPEGSVMCCYCGAAVEEETVVPPAEETISEQTVQQPPAPKNKANIWIVILAIVAGVALLAVLAGAILYGLGIDPIEALKPRKNDVLYKDNYYVEDDVAREKTEQVVATIGEETLTVGELQIYYWEAVYSFLDQNYYYLSAYGLDISKPLNEQACKLDEGKTWQQYFLDRAIETWQRYTTLELIAAENNYQINDEMQTFFDGLPESMQSTATNYGYDTVIAWLEDNCGPGVSEEGYINYITAYYMGTFYLTDNEELLNITDEEVNAYFAAHEEELAEAGITKDMGKYYDVRHILVELSGGTEDEAGKVTYSEEDWANCLAEAQRLLDEWKEKDGTEEGFASYAAQYSADPGSSSNGGLYQDLTADTNFIPEFKEWYLVETRMPGDTGIVKNTQSSVQGYHIMYFSASREMWYVVVSEELMSDKVSALIEDGMERFPMEVNYKKVVLGDKEIK